MRVMFMAEPVQRARADALLVPVDERGEVASAGPRAAMRAGLPPDLDREERLEELEGLMQDVRDEARQLGGWGSAAAVHGAPPFRWYVLARAMPHTTDARHWAAEEYAAVFRDAIAGAARATVAAGAKSLAMTLLGTSYRVTPELSANATARGLN